MIPIRTRASNFVYRGPTPDIGDAWVERRRGAVMLTWKPDDDERAAIAAGALIELGIYGLEPIPPVSLNVSPNGQLSPIGARLRERAYRALRAVSTGPTTIPAGHWSVSGDVWLALNAEEALDPPDGVPTLFGRPLLELDTDTPDVLEYTRLDPTP